MPFDYYRRLSGPARTAYELSERYSRIQVPHPRLFGPAIEALRGALAADDLAAVQAASHRIARGLTQDLRVSPANVQVLAVRPKNSSGELYGLYTPGDRRRPRIQVWMRTARQKRPVAFRTFLRTLLHEVGHHLDYVLLRLPDSLHTPAFYRRESSLFRQLVMDHGDAAQGAGAGAAGAAPGLDDDSIQATPDVTAWVATMRQWAVGDGKP